MSPSCRQCVAVRQWRLLDTQMRVGPTGSGVAAAVGAASAAMHSLTQPADMDTDTDISVRKPTDMSTFRGPSPVSPSQSSQAESMEFTQGATSASPVASQSDLGRLPDRGEAPLPLQELDVTRLPRPLPDPAATWNRRPRRSYAEINSPHMETEFTATGIVTIFTPPRTPSTGSTEGLCDNSSHYATMGYHRAPVRRSVSGAASAEGLYDSVVTYSREPRRLSSRNSSLEGLCDTGPSATYSRVYGRPGARSPSSRSVQTSTSPTSVSRDFSDNKPYSITALQEECMLALQQKLQAHTQGKDNVASQFSSSSTLPIDRSGSDALRVPSVSQQVVLHDFSDSIRAPRPNSLPLPDGAIKQIYCTEDLDYEADSGYSHSHGQNSDVHSFSQSQGQYSDLPAFYSPSQGHYSDLPQGQSDYSDLQTLDLELAALTAQEIADKWKPLFEKYDNGSGVVTMEDFRHHILTDGGLVGALGTQKIDLLVSRCCVPGQPTLSYQHFVNVLSSKRRHSFKAAVSCREQNGRDTSAQRTSTLRRRRRGLCLFEKMVRRIAKEFLTDDHDRQYYADNYSCWPPPIFMPAITLLEIAFYVYYTLESGDFSVNGPLPADSVFIYRPDRRLQIWRFLLYMLIHAGWVHLFFNMIVQLVVGVPLEMIHGSFRISLIYLAGVLAGSLGTSVFDMDAFLVGSSGGVYALLAAHLANILINYSEMELGLLKLAAVFIVASADVGFAIWDRYSKLRSDEPPVGYVSHLMGALAGLTIGLLVLKNFEQKLHSQVMWWIALAIYSACMLFAILWNIFYY